MKLRKILLLICIALMVLFSYFQLNDPGPYIWVPLYLIVAFLAYAKLKWNFAKSTFLIAAVLYLLWGISLYPPEWEGVMLNQVGMKTLNIELGRETFGLVICSVILTIFALID